MGILSATGLCEGGLGACIERPTTCEDVDNPVCGCDGRCGNPGACLPQPETCDPADTQQVCGCDGVTYPNKCTAFQAGARVSALGTCDCATNEDCEASEFCNAITCDGPGGCEERPATCPSEGPTVTGCDGDLYDNDCSAALQGVWVRPDN